MATDSLPVSSHSGARRDQTPTSGTSSPAEDEIKRRTDVVAIFPNERASIRLIGVLLLEQNDEWAVQQRYMTLETLDALSDDAARQPRKIAAA